MSIAYPSQRQTVTPLAAILGVAIAFWPVWGWYWSRITDGTDEPWGVLALLTMIVLLWRQPIPAPAPWQMKGVCVIMTGYLVTFHAAFPLFRAAMAMSAMALVLARMQSPLALWTLLLLSLPVVPSLQFFLGYPLRLLVADTSAGLLHLCGIAVFQEGTALRWAGETVLVDAPCSGLKMVWAGLYFAATLALWHRLRSVSALLLFLGSGVVILGANIIRSTLLFFKEAHVVAAPDWTHAGTGLVVFAAAALTIQRMCCFLKAREFV